MEPFEIVCVDFVGVVVPAECPAHQVEGLDAIWPGNPWGFAN